jgi:hypothetical protein
MNPRIRELAHEAGLPTYNPDGIPTKLEKFAELIVRECVGVCETMQLIGPYKEVQDATLKDASVQIKQHFGVDQ